METDGETGCCVARAVVESLLGKCGPGVDGESTSVHKWSMISNTFETEMFHLF